MKEILQLFRRDAEHAPPHPSTATYDLGAKPRILKDISSGGGSISESAGSSRETSVARKVTPPQKVPSVVKEDAVYGRRW